MTGSGLHRRAALGLMAGGLAASAGACARPDDGVTRLSLWAMGNEGAATPALLEEFHRLNPDVRVTVQALPWTAAHEKLLTAYAGDSLPDVSQVGNTWIAEMTAIGAATPVPADADDIVAGGFDSVMETNRVGGRLMGAPWYVDTRLVFYRTDLLSRAGYDAVPRDWTGWKRAMHAVKRTAGDGNYAILMPVNEFEQLLTFGLQTGEPLLRDNDSRGNFSSPAFVSALAFYKSLFDEGLAPTMSATQISNVWDEFSRGFFSFYFSGPWSVGDFRRRLSDAMQANWATVGVPGPDGPGASAPGGSSLIVFDSSPRKEAAWRLVRYLSQVDTQARFNALTGNLPAKVDAWDVAGIRGDDKLAPFEGQLERAVPVPKAPEWERVVTEMQVVAERMVRGEYTPETAGVEIDRRADRLLEKRRWMLDQGRAV